MTVVESLIVEDVSTSRDLVLVKSQGPETQRIWLAPVFGLSTITPEARPVSQPELGEP